jgi:HSP20 family molecular chaperone IbpA
MAERKRDMSKIHEEIQELFEDLWQVPRFSGWRRGWRPQLDCYRVADPPAVHVVVELAGVDPERLRLSVEGRVLTVTGRRDRPQVPGAQYRQMEIEYGPFETQVQLFEEVDTASAHAEYERGLLKVTLPVAQRAPAAEPVRIVVIRR